MILTSDEQIAALKKLLAEEKDSAAKVLEAGRVFVISMQNLHCVECGVTWGAQSPDDEGNERCESCEPRHAEVHAASMAFFPPISEPPAAGPSDSPSEPLVQP